MEKEFVPYELALKLKVLGFDEECMGCYLKDKNLVTGFWGNSDLYLRKANSNTENYLKVPLYQQAFDWFRDEQELWCYVFPDIHRKCWVYHVQYYKHCDYWGATYINDGYESYNEARRACLGKLIKIVEDAQTNNKGTDL